MGHTRLGKPPKTKKWKSIVASVATQGGVSSSYGGTVLTQDVDSVAGHALEAAEVGLENALEDEGLNYTFFLLTQVALAAREDDWRSRLSDFGISIAESTTAFDFISEIQNNIDDHLFSLNAETDISEMAQKAAGEALSELIVPKSQTLFGENEDTVKAAIRTFSTTRGFSSLGQKFFGLFMARFLNFYLSRVTAANVGGERLQHIGDLTEFNKELRKHCEESAVLVYAFSGEWYSKTEYHEGIDRENVKRFLAIALRKLRAEMVRERDDL